MSETANFTYEGNAVFKLSGSSDPPPAQKNEIEVLSIDHLIPINVRLKFNGGETVVSAFIDYTTETVYVSPGEAEHVGGDEEAVKQAVIQFLHDREAREIAEQEAQEAEMASEHYRIMQAQQARAYAAEQATMPEEDDDE